MIKKIEFREENDYQTSLKVLGAGLGPFLKN
jgi:hypothetical protein